MKYKIEKILTILGIISSAISAIGSWIVGSTSLALAWGTSCLWAINSLVNLTTTDKPTNEE